MMIDFDSTWSVAKHLAEQVATKALASAATGALGKVWGLMTGHLPAADQPKIAAAVSNPADERERADLVFAIDSSLKANPALLAELRALLQLEPPVGVTQTMTLGDNNRGVVQNTGSNVSISVSG